MPRMLNAPNGDLTARCTVLPDETGVFVMEYAYDRMGRCIRETDSRGNHVIHEYYADGNLKKDIYYDGMYFIYTRDASGNVVSVTDEAGAVTSYTYDCNGNHSVKEMEAEQAKGEREVPVLFEEMDGVWLNSQGEHHKKMKKQEMKVFTMYEGWDEEKEKQNRSTLVEKVMLAGMESSDEFHKKREATIQKKYNPDEIGQRILNGDGGSWIRETNDPEAIFQLDRFHIYQEILRKIADKEAQAEIRRLFDEEEIKKMFEYIETYATSVESNDAKDKRSQKARELYKYLDNNRNGLLPYDKRGVEIPKPRDGVIYKGMGIQENQNCTLITQRMKHRRMRWSKNGANNLAKILCRKENGELIETIDRFTDGLVFTLRMKEIVETLSAAKAPKRDGKGNPYIDIFGTHVPLKDAALTASRKAFLKIFG